VFSAFESISANRKARAFSAFIPIQSSSVLGSASANRKARAFSVFISIQSPGVGSASTNRKARAFSAFTPVKSTGVLGSPLHALCKARTHFENGASRHALDTAPANPRESHGPPRASSQRVDTVTACDVTTSRVHRSQRIPTDSAVPWSKTEHRACALHTTTYLINARTALPHAWPVNKRCK